MTRRRSTLVTLASGAGLNGIGSVGRTACLCLHSLVVARFLGAESLGVYAISLSLVVLIGEAGELGLRGGVTRFVGVYLGDGRQGHIRGVVGKAMVISSLASVAMALGLWCLAGTIGIRWLNEPRLVPALRILAPTVIFMALSNILAALTQAFRVMTYKVVTQDLIQVGLQLILSVVFIAMGYGLVGVLVANLIATVCAFLLLFVLAVRMLYLRTPSQEGSIAVSELLKFSLPLFLSRVLTVSSAKINILLLGLFVGAGGVAVFHLASQITVVGALFLSSFNMVFAPIIADLANRKKFDELQHVYQIATRWILTLALPFLAIFALMSGSLLSLFGPEFVLGSWALTILAVAQVFNVGTGSVGIILVMSNHPRVVSYNSAAGLALTVLMNLLLVPQYGLVGAAFAQAIVIVSVNLAALVEVRVLLRLHPVSAAYRTPFVAIAVAAFASCLAIQGVGRVQGDGLLEGPVVLAIGAAVLLVTYAAFHLIRGGDPEDIETLQTLKTKLSLPVLARRTRRNDAAQRDVREPNFLQSGAAGQALLPIRSETDWSEYDRIAEASRLKQ